MSAKRKMSRAYKEAMVVALGTRCVNCGSEEYIEYHHIVPLCLGGVDKLSNMAALCSKCHKAAHRGRHLSHYVNTANSGRKTTVSKEEAYKAFDLYFAGKIGTRKCKEMLGYSKSVQIKVSPHLNSYLAEKGIADYKNQVDLVATVARGGLYEGVCVGYVKYKDGRFEDLFYENTGLNDVEYAKRTF